MIPVNMRTCDIAYIYAREQASVTMSTSKSLRRKLAETA